MKTDERECRGCINVGKRLKLIRWEFETKCKILVVDSSANKRVGRFFVFFKQKTAYEILRDWSSDVCSSDLRSQVYGGRSTEHPVTDRAVAETEGRVATYAGRPINALYTSTCGGRTEDAENIFGGEAPAYLRGRECALDSHEHFAPYTVRTTRELPNVKLAEHAASARDAALLAVHGFSSPARLTDEWLAAPVTAEELGALFGRVATLARQPAPCASAESTRPAGFATALALALDGESRGAVLLNSADVSYTLSFRDASDVPAQSRADVAAMLREGHLSLYADGTLRPKQVLTRARALHSVAHALEARGLL